MARAFGESWLLHDLCLLRESPGNEFRSDEPGRSEVHGFTDPSIRGSHGDHGSYGCPTRPSEGVPLGLGRSPGCPVSPAWEASAGCTPLAHKEGTKERLEKHHHALKTQRKKTLGIAFAGTGDVYVVWHEHQFTWHAGMRKNKTQTHPTHMFLVPQPRHNFNIELVLLQCRIVCCSILSTTTRPASDQKCSCLENDSGMPAARHPRIPTLRLGHPIPPASQVEN